MKLGLIGKLFPLMFSKVVYGYTAEAPAGDCCDFHVAKGTGTKMKRG